MKKQLKEAQQSVFALHTRQLRRYDVATTTVDAQDADCDPPGHDPFEGSGPTVQDCMEGINKLAVACAALAEGEGEGEAEEAEVGYCGMAMPMHCPNL